MSNEKKSIIDYATAPTPKKILKNRWQKVRRYVIASVVSSLLSAGYAPSAVRAVVLSANYDTYLKIKYKNRIIPEMTVVRTAPPWQKLPMGKTWFTQRDKFGRATSMGKINFVGGIPLNMDLLPSPPRNSRELKQAVQGGAVGAVVGPALVLGISALKKRRQKNASQEKAVPERVWKRMVRRSLVFLKNGVALNKPNLKTGALKGRAFLKKLRLRRRR